MKPRFTADIETLLYLASGLCIAVALGILVIPSLVSETEQLQGDIISTATIDALAPVEEPSPGRVTQPMLLDTSLETQNISPSSLIEEARIALQQNNGRNALDLLLQAQDQGEKSEQVQILLAEAHMKTRNFEVSSTLLTGTLSQDPSNISARTLHAEVLMHQAGSSEKESLLNDALQLLQGIQTERSVFLSCLIATYQNNTEVQQTTCEQAKQSGTLDARIAQDILSQRQLFATFRDGNRSYIDLLHAKSIADAGFYDLSSVMTRRIVEQHRDYRDAWVVLGYNYLVIEKYSLAQVALETAYQLDTTKAHIQYLLAIAYDKQMQKEKAVSFYTLALDNQYPNKTALRQRIAQLYVDTQKFDLALRQYLALVDENALAAPEMYVTPIWIALEFAQDTVAARSIAEKAKEKFPESAISDNLLGWVALTDGRLEQAETYLKQSIEGNASYDAPWYNLGRVYEGLNRLDEARNAYQQAYTVGGNSQIARLAAENYNRLQ